MPTRVIDTPISEAAIIGVAIGAAMTGLRPVVEIMFGDFITLAMDQLVNQAAKVHYMSAGGFTCRWCCAPPSASAAISGRSIRRAFMPGRRTCPGLKVVMPSDAHDAKGLMKAAHPRRRPGGLLREPLELQPQGRGARGGLRGAARPRGGEARGPRHQRGGDRRDRAARAQRRRAAQWSRQRRSGRCAQPGAARYRDPRRVGEEDLACAGARRRPRALRHHRRDSPR